MENRVTEQLKIEIQKLKAGDYSSYQNFYNETIQPLFGVIWEIVQDQDVTNALVTELYTNIYATIRDELKDDNQFFTWATNKAKLLAETQTATKNASAGTGLNLDNNLASLHQNANSFMGNAPAGNASMGTAPTGNVAMGQSATGNVAMGQSATGNVAMGQSTTGNVAMGQSATGNVAMGQGATGNVAMGHGATGNVALGNGASAGAKTATGTLAKTGMSLGAKIAIGVASAVVATGIGIGVYTLVNTGNKDSETTKEAVTEITVEEDTTEAVTTEGEVTEEPTSEETTDEALDEATIARYAAYYEVVKTYMEQYGSEVKYSVSGWSCIYGIRFVDMVDFNGDGNKQLVIVYKDDSNYHNNIMADVYDYVDGSAELLASVDCGCSNGDYGTKSVGVCEENGKAIVWILEAGMNRAIMADTFYNRLSFSDANELEIHTYFTDGTVMKYFVDGTEIDEATYKEYENQRDSELEQGSLYAYDSSGISFGTYQTPDGRLAKTLLLKHRAIELMASCAGDTAFANESDITFSEADEDYSKNVLTSTPNKYNEVYKIYGNHDDVCMPREISADGKNIHLYENQEVESSYSGSMYDVDADLYFEYLEDALVLVGHKRLVYENIDGTREVRTIFCWYTADDYLYGLAYDATENDDIMKYSISEDEFSSRGAALMEK